MAYAYDKPKGSRRWYEGYVDERGIVVQKKSAGRTYAEAKRLADEKELHAARVRAGLEAPTPQQITFEEAVKQFLVVAKAKTSYATMEGRFRLHLVPHFGQKLLTQITPASIEAFLVSKKDELSPQSREHLRVHLSALFSFAAKKARIFRGDNPAALVARVEIPPRDPKHLEAEWVPAVIAQISDRWRGLFACAVYTGLRKGELLGLRVQNVDLKRRIILVNRSYTGNTKGKKARIVAIPEGLVPFLQMELGRTRSEFLFPGAKGGMQSKSIKFETMLRSALKRAGIVQGFDHVCRRKGCGFTERRADDAISPCPQCGFQLWPKGVTVDLSFKDLRSTFGTFAYEATGDLRYVQRGLGHRDIETTEKRYAHLRTEHLLEQADKLRFGTYPTLTGHPKAGDTTLELVPETAETTEGNMTRDRGFEPLAFGSGGLPNAINNSNHWPLATVTNLQTAKQLRTVAVTGHQAQSTTTYPALTSHVGEGLLRVDDVARALSLCAQTVRNMVKRGQLQAVRVAGNQLRFRRSDIETYLVGGGDQ